MSGLLLACPDALEVSCGIEAGSVARVLLAFSTTIQQVVHVHASAFAKQAVALDHLVSIVQR